MKKIGFDLDNTIINYAATVRKYCVIKGIPVQNSIDSLRHILKKSENDQGFWIEAQSWIYGPGIESAQLANNFVKLCQKLKEMDYEIKVFSHKTEFGPKEFGSQPFRNFANTWLQNSDAHQYLSPKQNVSYFNSLNEKVAAINKYSPNYYIDDLLKVFAHPDYNRTIKSFIYGRHHKEFDWLFSINDFDQLKSFIR